MEQLLGAPGAAMAKTFEYKYGTDIGYPPRGARVQH